MALVVKDRVQEVTTTSGTGTLTLSGAVPGYQTFSSSIGNGNTTFYTIYDNTAQDWEVGIGTVGAGTLARTTVLSNSLGTTAKISFVGNSSFVFCTYPAEQSVNLDASNNVSPLGTIASGTWNGSTIGVAYGGTGVTTSSGANSVMLRDSNQNVAVNRLNQSNTNTSAAGGVTALTTASSYIHTLSGTGNQTYTMPDATTLSTGVAFLFNNMATGTLTLQDYATGSIGTIPSGGAAAVFLTVNATVGGTWDLHAYLPEGVTFGTNAFNLGTSIISGGTWQGGTIQSAYGGTGLTSFAAANNALYSTSSSALVAGTLPIQAGGTAATTFTANGVIYGNGTSALGVTAAGTTGQVLVGNTGGAPSWATVSSSLVSSFQTSLSGLSPSTATTGAVTLAGTLGVTSGGTGASTAFTTGSVVFAGASGTYTQDNANFFWDDSNNRLGIGTSSPQATVHVVNQTNTGWRYDQYNNGDGTNFRNFRARGTIASPTAVQTNDRLGSFLAGGYGATAGFSNVNGGMSIYAAETFSASACGTFLVFGTTATGANTGGGGTERMRIDSSGNVGIGTTSPAERLHVNGGDIRIQQTVPELKFVSEGNVNRWYIGANISDAVDGGMCFGNGTGVGNNERMRIDSSGNVGIGTTSPTAKLDVAGVIVTRGDGSEGGQVTINNPDNASIGMAIDVQAANIGRIFSGNNNSELQLGQLVGTGGIVRLFTAASERMRIDSSGNVGIGTASPASYAPLTVRKYITSGAQNYAASFSDAVNATLSIGFTSGFANYVCDNGQAFYTSNTERMRIHSSGGVSIGNTTDPGATNLSVTGNLQFNSGYGSAATAYGCRAWVNFNGTGTIAIRGSGNVSSLTDLGNGYYRVNLTTAMPDTNYNIVTSCWLTSASNALEVATSRPLNTSQFYVVTGDNNSDLIRDEEFVSASVFR